MRRKNTLKKLQLSFRESAGLLDRYTIPASGILAYSVSEAIAAAEKIDTTIYKRYRQYP
jgi:hypothetical protein